MFKGGGLGSEGPNFGINLLDVPKWWHIGVIYHIVARIENFQKTHMILVWLPWLPHRASDWLNTKTIITTKRKELPPRNLGGRCRMTIRMALWSRIVYTVAMATRSRPIREFHTVIQIYDKISKIRLHSALDLNFLNTPAKGFGYTSLRFWVMIVQILQVCAFRDIAI